MNREERFIQALRQNITPRRTPTVVAGTIKSTQDTECTIELTATGVAMENVHYGVTEDNKKGIRIKPKAGTNALALTIGEDENSLYLLTMDEIEQLDIDIDGLTLSANKDTLNIKLKNTTLELTQDKIKFNGGTNGGLVKIELLVGKLNALENDINALKNILATTWVPVPQDGGLALKTALASWTTQLAVSEKRELENEKITH